MARNSTYPERVPAPSAFPSQSDSIDAYSGYPVDSAYPAASHFVAGSSRVSERRDAEIIDFNHLAAQRQRQNAGRQGSSDSRRGEDTRRAAVSRSLHSASRASSPYSERTRDSRSHVGSSRQYTGNRSVRSNSQTRWGAPDRNRSADRTYSATESRVSSVNAGNSQHASMQHRIPTPAVRGEGYGVKLASADPSIYRSQPSFKKATANNSMYRTSTDRYAETGSLRAFAGQESSERRGVSSRTRIEEKPSSADRRCDGREAVAEASADTSEGRPSRWGRFRKQYRKKKADRKFEKSGFSEEPLSDEDAPRPGLYKGEMGSSARKSARMQQQADPMPSSASTKSSHLNRIWSVLSLRSGLIVAACLALSIAFVYPAAQDYYIALRTQDQANAEYEAVVARNEEIQDRVDTLNTDEGIEDLARTKYGYVMEGETSVAVSGLYSDDIDAQGTENTAAVTSGSVSAPETWYSPVLDVVFGYSD